MKSSKGRPTRRTMLNLALAAGAVVLKRDLAIAQGPLNCAPINPPVTATPFTPNTALPMRVRKSAFDLDVDEIARLKAAFAALRRLSEDDPLDPRGWLNQAHVHCWYCGGPQGDSSTEIHGSWDFMPWHRAYLYFFERILAKLIGDDTFALPYWDWDTVRTSPSGTVSLLRAVLPLPYINPNGPSNPLHNPLRLATATERIPASFVGPTMMDPIMLNTSTVSFFGSQPPFDPATSTSGMVEFGPHGIVHLWVGDPLRRDRSGTSDMGVLSTAARDPLFFAHHANIDFIWDRWRGQGGGRENPSSPDWLNTTWTFFDENAQWTSIKASDVVNLPTLRYRYQPPPPPPTNLATPARPQAAAATLVAQAGPPLPSAPVMLANPQQNLKLGPDPVTRSVALPDQHREALRAMAAPRPSGNPVIRITNVQGPPGTAAIIRVFVNLAAASPTTPVSDPHYVGTFSLVPNSLRGTQLHGHTGLNVELPLRAQTQQLISSEQELSVTLVPVAGDDAAPFDLALTIGSISLSSR